MHLGLKKKIIIIIRRKLDYRELFRFAKTALKTRDFAKFSHKINNISFDTA